MKIIKKYFSIGEMAKLNYVSAQTLRYYDKIGLLKPEYIHPETGYRYYTYEQFLMLDTIHYLKLFGMQLEDIKEQFEERTILNSLEVYKKQLVDVQKNIDDLKYVEKRIQHNIDNLIMSEQLRQKKDIEILSFENRYMSSIHTSIASDEEYEIAIRSLSYRLYSNNFRAMGDFIGIKAKEDIIKGNYEKYTSIGTLIKRNTKDYPMETIKGGDYACVYHFGSANEISQSYQRLCHYISKNDYEITGQVIEVYIVDMMDTKNPSEYISHIQIPIKKK